MLDLMIGYCNDTAHIIHKNGSREDLENEVTYQFALAGAIQQIGECARQIDIWLKNHSDYNWSKVIGMRNMLSHKYHALDLDILWGIASNKVPEVLEIAMKLRDEVDSCPDEDFLNISSKGSRRDHYDLHKVEYLPMSMIRHENG